MTPIDHLEAERIAREVLEAESRLTPPPWLTEFELRAKTGEWSDGGTVIDPALVRALVAARRLHDPLDVLSAREREVLALMAEGCSNAGIASALFVTEGTVEKHVHGRFVHKSGVVAL